jgi:hypothetical protein
MEILPLECCVFLYSGLQTTIQSHTTNRAHKALGTFENAIMVIIKYVYQALHLVWSVCFPFERSFSFFFFNYSKYSSIRDIDMDWTAVKDSKQRQQVS